jgi:sulfur-carrier protein
MQVLYFGWVRAKIGKEREEIELPDSVGDLRALIAWLAAKGGGYHDALADMTAVRAAVNQELTGLEAKIGNGDEVAFFPPMTGG